MGKRKRCRVDRPFNPASDRGSRFLPSMQTVILNLEILGTFTIKILE